MLYWKAHDRTPIVWWNEWFQIINVNLISTEGLHDWVSQIHYTLDLFSITHIPYIFFAVTFSIKNRHGLRWKVESWFYIMNKIIIIIVVEAKKDWVKPQRLVICFPNIFAFGKMISRTLSCLFRSNKFIMPLSSWWFALTYYGIFQFP